MTLRLSAIAAATAIATGSVQLFWSLASGSYSVGSRIEQMQSDLKLLRNDVQNQSRLSQAQNQIYEFRLQQLEDKKSSGNGRRE